VKKAGTPEAYAELKAGASKALRLDWKCEPLEKLLGPQDGASDEGSDEDEDEGSDEDEPDESADDEEESP
jgi:hypothetical protein